MEIDTENVNYLISRIRDLELKVKLGNNAESAFYNMESKLRDENSRLKEDNENLKDSVISHQQRINELIDGNKCDKEELELTEKARVKWKERWLKDNESVEAAKLYQKELVKAEKENKILANELLAITNQTGTKARPKISISHDGKNAQYVIDKFVDFDHPFTIDILAKHEARMNAEEDERQYDVNI